jgi:hypothetical protein
MIVVASEGSQPNIGFHDDLRTFKAWSIAAHRMRVEWIKPPVSCGPGPGARSEASNSQPSPVPRDNANLTVKAHSHRPHSAMFGMLSDGSIDVK